MSNYLGNQRVCYMQPRIPYEYQEVEYIESSSTQYIDTEVFASENNSFEVKAQLLHTNTTSQTIWGGRNSANAGSLQSNQLSCVKSLGKYQFSCGDVVEATIGFDTNLHIFKAEKNILYIDGSKVQQVASTQITAKNNVYLFATNANGTIGFHGGALRMYYCKIWSNDTLVRDFIPCYRKSDGARGLYDLVNRKFHENKGTGDFIKGPNSTKIIKFEKRVHLKLPYEYQEVEYIQTTGTQYIDTDYYATPNTKICAVFKFNNDIVNTSAIGQTIFGVVGDFSINFGGDVSQKNQFFIWLNEYNSSADISTVTFPSGEVNKKMYYEVDAGTQTYIIGNRSGNINTKKTTKSTISFPILGSYTQAYGKKIPFDDFPAYLYSFQIFDKDENDKMVMVKNFIPCYRKNDGEIGLFDTVNRVFYTNSGTGVFLKGGDVK